MRTTALWLTALSIVLGFITAFAALHHAGDALVYVLLVLFGGLLGYIAPQAPWRWAIVLGIWVPIAEIVSRMTDPSGPPPTTQLLLPLIALLPPFLGVYLGVLVRVWFPPPKEIA